jgi:PAS domain-containing protein
VVRDDEGCGDGGSKHVPAGNKSSAVHLDSISFIDRARVARELRPTGATVEVPAGSSQLELKYSAPSFSDPPKVRFAYQLIRNGKVLERPKRRGDTRERRCCPPAVTVSRSRRPTITTSGARRPRSCSSRFSVYWQTAWFRGLVLLAALGGGGGVAWRVQQNKLRRQQQQLAQERALAQEQARLASVLEATTDFVGFAAPGGQPLYINPAADACLV